MPNTYIKGCALAVVAFALAGCAQMDRERQVSAPAATPVGEKVSCIQLSRIDHSEVHDDYTIDFVMHGGTRYRNTLPNRCPSLGFEQRFSYKTSLSQLCSTDIIHVLYSDGHAGASCGLGQFQPVKLDEE